jgi:hypothetical protein
MNSPDSNAEQLKKARQLVAGFAGDERSFHAGLELMEHSLPAMERRLRDAPPDALISVVFTQPGDMHAEDTFDQWQLAKTEAAIFSRMLAPPTDQTHEEVLTEIEASSEFSFMRSHIDRIELVSILGGKAINFIVEQPRGFPLAVPLIPGVRLGLKQDSSAKA